MLRAYHCTITAPCGMLSCGGTSCGRCGAPPSPPSPRKVRSPIRCLPPPHVPTLSTPSPPPPPSPLSAAYPPSPGSRRLLLQGEHSLDAEWLRLWRQRRRGVGGGGAEIGGDQRRHGSGGGGAEEAEASSSGFLFCEQRPGDVMYAPLISRGLPRLATACNPPFLISRALPCCPSDLPRSPRQVRAPSLGARDVTPRGKPRRRSLLESALPPA